MPIVDEDVERVRQGSDLVDVVSKHVALRKVGRRWTGLCPFHAERTPSFSVNGEDGLYYCFGCQARGDVISFVRQVEQLDFVGAVEWLAARAGITLRYTTSGEGKERARRKRLVEAMAAAVEWYHERLLSAADAAPARGLPAIARVRRRDRAPVQARMGARRVGCAEPRAQAARRRAARHRPRLPQPSQPPAGLVSSESAVPDRRRAGRSGRVRRASPSRAPKDRSTRTRRTRRSTRRAECSTASTVPSRRSSPLTR